jgi:outer membrane receptor protein involved in Fe transport
MNHVDHEAWEERLILKQLFGFGDHVRGIATLYQEWFNSTVNDPEGELAFYSSTRIERGSSSGVRLFLVGDTWNHLKADTRLEGRWERFRSEVDGGGEVDVTQRRRTLGAGAGLTLFGSESVRSRGEIGVISNADRQDNGHVSEGSTTTGRVAVEYTFRDDLTATISWSMQGRVPTLFELYGNQGSVKGNTDLEPEKGTQVEATLFGWEGRFRVAAYIRRVDDQIQFWLRSPRVILPENIGEAEMKGIELSLDAAETDPVHLVVRGSYQETEDKSNVPYYRGNELPGRPNWKGYVRVTTAISSRTRCGLDLRLESDFYRDRANRRLESGKAKLGAWIELRGLWNLEIRLSGENLTDETGNDQWGYPLAGRRVRLTLSYSSPE